MDDSLWWLTFWMGLLFGSFFVYLALSSCIGPPLIRALREMLSTHWRATNRNEWDEGGIRYRESSRRRTFIDGRGGAEGYEMATMVQE
ncbi:hypothetical protein JCM10212_004392 [Sporobolomyces blumeae]